MKINKRTIIKDLMKLAQKDQDLYYQDYIDPDELANDIHDFLDKLRYKYNICVELKYIDEVGNADDFLIYVADGVMEDIKEHLIKLLEENETTRKRTHTIFNKLQQNWQYNFKILHIQFYGIPDLVIDAEISDVKFKVKNNDKETIETIEDKEKIKITITGDELTLYRAKNAESIEEIFMKQGKIIEVI